MNQTPSRQFLYFPDLHSSLGPATLPSEVRFLDPGLAEAEDGRYWRPEGLVLEPEQARRALGDLLAYGEQFSPQDLAALALSDFGDDPAQSSMAIQSDLRRMLKKETPDPKAVQRQVRLQGQMMLILAWALEERYMELDELERGFADSWNKFSEELGLDAAERQEAGLSDDLLTPVRHRDISWRRLLGPFALVAPAATCLVTGDADIYEELTDAGVRFHDVPEASALAGGQWGTFSLASIVSTREWDRLNGFVVPEQEIIFWAPR